MRHHSLFVLATVVMLAISAPSSVQAAETAAEKAENVTEEKTPVVGEETKTEEAPAENPGRFAPDFCDFEITFPEAAYTRPKCLPDGKCYDLHSYTMVYDLQTTVDVSVTCNPSTPASYGRYNQAVMKAALEGMVSERRLNEYDVSFRDDKITKGASLSGTGVTGTQEKIYSAQLWIGQNSVMTVQAELIGMEHPEADKVFSDILASIKAKEGKQLPKVEKPTVKTN